MKWLQLLHVLLPGSRLIKFKRDLIRQQSAIHKYLVHVQDNPQKAIEYCTVSKKPCRSAGLLMWTKDTAHRYTFANMRHCNDFYYLPLIKVKRLIGKTDMELVQEFRKRTGLRHTFGAMCKGTDDYVLDMNRQVRFWEMGYINGGIMILDVTKRPEYDADGKVIGTSGWAYNMSDRECEIKSLLNVFLQTNEAIPFEVQHDKQVASYIIKKQTNPFNGEFPK